MLLAVPRADFPIAVMQADLEDILATAGGTVDKAAVLEMFRHLEHDLQEERTRYQNLNAVAVAHKKDAIEARDKCTTLEAEVEKM